MKYIFFLLLFLFFWAGCSGDEQSHVTEDAVARVGDNMITRQDFEISYWLEPQYAIRTSLANAYQSQVNYLIQQEYYYLAGERSGLAEETELMRKIDYINEKEAYRAFIHEHFLDTIKVSDQQLRQGLQRLAKKRHTLNIFSKDKQEIEKIQTQIKSSKTDPAVIFAMHGQDLGWITFGNVDPAVEEAVYNLSPGSVSNVITSSYGYHLIMVPEEQPNFEFQNMPDQLRLENVIETIRKRIADDAIRDQLEKLSSGQKIGVNNAVMRKIVEQFLLLANPAEQNPQIVVPPLNNRELRQVALGTEDLRQEPLVRMGSYELTVDQFLERLRIMPPFHRPYLKGYNRFNQAVIDMIRNDLLTQKAMEMGYLENAGVKQQVHKHTKELISREFRNRYFSDDFKNNNPEQWQKYDEMLNDVKNNISSDIFEKNLFGMLSDPDSIITRAPVPVMLKSRYLW
jgi:hypothetical protein